MVIVSNLELTGKKCVTGEIGGGIVLFGLNQSMVIEPDECNLLREFLNKKYERETEND